MKVRKLFPSILLSLVLSVTSFAQSGRAINTDGADDYIDPNHLPNFNNNFTMELWARPTATHEIDNEMSYGIDGVYNQRFVVWPTWRGFDGGIGISMGTNGVSVYEHGSNSLPALLVHATPISGWTYVAVVVSNKNVLLYINGQFIKSGISTISANLWPSLGECGQYPGLVGGIGGGTYGYFEGDIDEVRLWSTVRTQQQIQANMYSEFNCLIGLYAYYKLNHGVAGGNNGAVLSATDHSGNNFNASLIGFSLSQGNLSNWIAPGPATSTSNPISIVATKSVLCLGETTSISATGGQNYSWSTGASGGTINVTPQATKIYTVSGNIAGGCTYSASITLTVSECTQISKHYSDKKIKIFPNPAASYIQVELSETAHYEIINCLGQILSQGKMHQGGNSLSISTYESGVYYLKINKNNNSTIHSFVKE